jgi:Type IIA topoisomerase (DNA gyrase/topo II, topoisomerase IV), A subunit
VTQRGAFKRLAMKELSVTSRARRGVIVLRELKREPHRVVDFLVIPHDNPALEVITSRERTHDILPTEHPLSGRYSNGSFVVDTDVEGIPTQLRLKPTELVLN